MESEINQWVEINKYFKHHGLNKIDIKPLSSIASSAAYGDEYIILSLECSLNLRTSIHSLIRDCDRRQDLIKELITSNNVLREELKQTKKYNEKSDKLKYPENQFSLSELKEEVESFNGLQIDISKYNALSNQCKEMQDKCEQYERALNRLNQKLKKIDEELIDKVLEVISQPTVCDIITPFTPSLSNHTDLAHKACCNRKWQCIVPVLKQWAVQISALPELQNAIRELQLALLLESIPTLSEKPNVAIMAQAINALKNSHQTMCQAMNSKKYPDYGKTNCNNDASKNALQSIIEYFMKLFNIQHMKYCYTYINELYVTVEESRNVMNALRSLLLLESTANNTAVVDAVARLCQAHNLSTLKVFTEISGNIEFDSLIENIHLQECFLPYFEHTIQKLMEILDISKMDEILPAVRALKLLTEQ